MEGSETIWPTEILESHDENRAVLFEEYTSTHWLDKDCIELEKTLSINFHMRFCICACFKEKYACPFGDTATKQPGNIPDFIFFACLLWEGVSVIYEHLTC